MEKVAFISDTGAGFSIEEINHYGVHVIPLQIIIDGSVYLEQEEIQTDEVYRLISQGTMLKTSLASMQRAQEIFNALKAKGYTKIFAIPLTAKISGTLNMMRICAEDCGITFTYYDCKVAACMQKYMLIRAKQLYEQGQSWRKIIKTLDEIRMSGNTILIPDDLKHLQRSGRLTPVAATLGSLLKIKPLLQIGERTDGTLDVLDKVRTMKKAITCALDDLQSHIPNEGKDYMIYVAHVLNTSQREELLNACKRYFPYATYVLSDLVGAIGIHTGVGCIGVQYFKMI